MISNLIAAHIVLIIFLLPVWIYYFKVTKKQIAICEGSKKDKKLDKIGLIIWTVFVGLVYAAGMIATFL